MLRQACYAQLALYDGRPSDAGPRIDYSVDFVRVFRVEPVGVDPRDDA